MRIIDSTINVHRYLKLKRVNHHEQGIEKNFWIEKRSKSLLSVLYLKRPLTDTIFDIFYIENALAKITLTLVHEKGASKKERYKHNNYYFYDNKLIFSGTSEINELVIRDILEKAAQVLTEANGFKIR